MQTLYTQKTILAMFTKHCKPIIYLFIVNSLLFTVLVLTVLWCASSFFSFLCRYHLVFPSVNVINFLSSSRSLRITRKSWLLFPVFPPFSYWFNYATIIFIIFTQPLGLFNKKNFHGINISMKRVNVSSAIGYKSRSIDDKFHTVVLCIVLSAIRKHFFTCLFFSDEIFPLLHT